MADQQPPPPPAPPPSAAHPVHKTLATAANLANLLPTGTVLAFQTLAPSFSNKGNICQLSNKLLTTILLIFCSISCFLSSFTDSFTDSHGKLYYGIATFKGLYIFNRDHEDTHEQDFATLDLSKFRLSLIDFVHAFSSLFVFVVFAFCDSDLQKCLFPFGGANVHVLVMNLPLAVGVFSTFLFTIFPTTRRGIGYSDTQSAKFR